MSNDKAQEKLEKLMLLRSITESSKLRQQA